MALKIATGTYTGNGGTSGTRAITGIGFTPKAVFVWSASTTAGITASPMFTFTSAITGLGTNLGFLGENGWFTATTGDRFQSFDSDGFTISKGSATAYLNENSTVFHYLAMGGDDIVTDTYAGNNTDNRNITGLPFEPEWVLLMGGAQHSAMKFSSSGVRTDNASYTYNAANAANMIQSLNTDGFQVGTAAQVNASATNYYYMAVKRSVNVYQGRYTGNGSDNRDITGIGFPPDLVFIKSTGARNFAIRSSTHTGDLSKYYRSSGFAANYIQSFSADGFQIGSSADINTNTEAVDFIAFKNNQADFEVNVFDDVSVKEADSINGYKGWMKGFAYRKKVTFTGEVGAGKNYNIFLQVGASSGGSFNLGGNSLAFPAAQGDGGDLRFTLTDGDTQIPFWVEDVVSGVASIWIKHPENLDTSKEFYIYYGKTAAGNASNGSATFVHFDDFEGASVDTNKWVVESGSPTVSSSEVNMGINGTMRMKDVVATGPFSFGFRLRRTGAVDTGMTARLIDSVYTSVQYGNTSYAANGVYSYGVGAFELSQTGHGNNTTGDHIYRLKVYGTTLRWDQSALGGGTRTMPRSVDGERFDVALFAGGASYPGNPIDFTYLRPQTASGVEPSFSSAGAQEIQPYAITALSTALEYDTTNSLGQFVAQLSPTRVVVAWSQSTTVKHLQTFEVNRTTGGITANSTPLTFDTSSIAWNYEGKEVFIQVIDATTILVAWQGLDSDGYAQTFQINAGTGAVTAWGSAVEFDTTWFFSGASQLVDVVSGIARVLVPRGGRFGGGTNQTGVAIWSVDMTTGAVTIGTNTALISGNGSDNWSLNRIDHDTFLVTWAYWDLSDMYAYSAVLKVDRSTWDVSILGSVNNWLVGDLWSGSTTVVMDQLNGKAITLAGGWDGAATIQAQSLSFNEYTGTISLLGSLQNSLRSGAKVSLAQVSSHRLTDSHFVLFSEGPDDDGYVRTWDFDPVTGQTSLVTELEFDTTNGISATSVDMGGGLFVAAWTGTDTDGFIRAFSINQPFNVAQAFETVGITESVTVERTTDNYDLEVADTVYVNEWVTRLPVNPAPTPYTALTTKQVIYGGLPTAAPSTSAVSWATIHSQNSSESWAATQAWRRTIFSGPVRPLRIAFSLSAAPGVGTSYEFALVQSTGTVLGTATVSDLATTAELDFLNTTIEADTTLSIRCTPTGTPASTFVMWGLSYETTEDNIFMINGSTGSGPTATDGAISYNHIMGGGTWSTTTSALRENISSLPFVIRKFSVLTVAPGTGNSRTMAVMLNGVQQIATNLVFGPTDDLLTVTGLNILVMPGDTLSIVNIASGTPTTSGLNTWSISAENFTPGESWVAGSTTDGTGTAPSFIRIKNSSASAESTTASNVHRRSVAPTHVLKDFILWDKTATRQNATDFLTNEIYIGLANGGSLDSNTTATLGKADVTQRIGSSAPIVEGDNLTVTFNSFIGTPFVPTIAHGFTQYIQPTFFNDVAITEYIETEVTNDDFTVDIFDAIVLEENISTENNTTTEVNSTVAITEQATTELIAFVVVSDAITITESLTLEETSFINLSDAVGITESLATEVTLNQSVVDTIGITESQTLDLVLTLFVSDIIGITESTATFLPFELNTFDVVTITEFAFGNTDLFPSEDITISEFVQIERSLLEVSVVDNISVTESAAPLRVYLLSIVDSVTVTENITTAIAFEVNVTEAITVTDVATSAPLLFEVAASDNLAITEQVTHELSVQVSLSESLSIVEDVQSFMAFSASLADSLTVTDSLTVAPLTFTVEVHESVLFAESISAAVFLQLSVSDSITIDEDTDRAIAYLASVSDTVSIAEFTDTFRFIPSNQLPADRYRGTSKRINMKAGGSI